ncbi:MAG: hypothetical protein DLM61_02060 [Pseudonocardiales bacterium]|nr:MAG: hypothetical protein DLM61_02060 [Pseudonocardiales bacterium]
MHWTRRSHWRLAGGSPPRPSRRCCSGASRARQCCTSTEAERGSLARQRLPSRRGRVDGEIDGESASPFRLNPLRWLDLTSATSLSIAILNTEQFRALTGREPPPSPVSAALYTEHGLPWFHLYERRRATSRDPRCWPASNR